MSNLNILLPISNQVGFECSTVIREENVHYFPQNTTFQKPTCVIVWNGFIIPMKIRISIAKICTSAPYVLHLKQLQSTIDDL